MTEQEYAALAAACDRLLRAPDTTLARVAIPLLHVVNEHPNCLRQYEALSNRHPLAARAQRAPPFTRSATVPARAGRILTRALWRPPPAAMISAPPGGIDVLIVSRLTNPSQLELEQDFYFGDLQALLQERGLTSMLLFVNHLTPHHPLRAGAQRSIPSARLLMPQAVDTATERRIWRQCLLAWKQLRHAARRADLLIDANVAKLAASHALFGGTAGNLRLHAAIAQLCDRLNPAMVITTYEGTASERMIWHAARSPRNHRQALCVGYQHTRLLPRAHAIRRPVGVPGIDCDPDIVLTLGEIPHATLADSPELGATQLILYGSHRRMRLPQTLPSFAQRSNQCLVLADGEERECVLLFTFALECAERMPPIRFILRPHPIMSIDRLRVQCPALRNLPGNVDFSPGESLEDACVRSRYCLYRGSSAALHAAMAGVQPFYLAQAGELSFDALHSLADAPTAVSSVGDFAARLRVADATRDVQAAQRRRQFCERYISAVRPTAIDELLTFSHETGRHSRRPSSASSAATSSAK